ncbi:hypothetical protein [Amycolatopsis sp. cg9]|uniref:hypothetical protein n=1 Tax=Amycolatopsis sp. cg9 TaxID=3238801 RepID=UPI0035246DA5
MSDTEKPRSRSAKATKEPSWGGSVAALMLLAGIVLVIAVAPASCSPEDTMGAPGSPPAPHTDTTVPMTNPTAPVPTGSTPLSKFVAECEQGVSNWKSAQVDYPATVALEKRVAGVYVAAVDVGDQPLPPDKVIPGTDPTSAQIGVQCLLSARLVGDDTTHVYPPEWVPSLFNPAGVLNWSWTVTGTASGNRQLRLQLQPAVAESGNRPYVVAGGSPQRTLTYVSQLDVHEPAQTFFEAVAENWGIVSAVLVAVGAAVVGVVKWGGDLGDELRRFRASWRHGKSDAIEPQTTSSPTTKAKTKTRRTSKNSAKGGPNRRN